MKQKCLRLRHLAFTSSPLSMRICDDFKRPNSVIVCKGLSPSLFLALGSALEKTRISVHRSLSSSFPSKENPTTWRGELYSMSKASTFAPFSMRSCKHSWLPFCAALWSGVQLVSISTDRVQLSMHQKVRSFYKCGTIFSLVKKNGQALWNSNWVCEIETGCRFES